MLKADNVVYDGCCGSFAGEPLPCADLLLVTDRSERLSMRTPTALCGTFDSAPADLTEHHVEAGGHGSAGMSKTGVAHRP
jgi:hypothetical protein